jgi:erythromycin esterase-like protein
VITDALRASCHKAIADTLQYLKTNHNSILQKSSNEELDLALLSLKGLDAFEDEQYYNGLQPSQPAPSNAARDQAMAVALIDLRQLWFPKARAIIWAHNVHLEKAGDQDVFFW